MRQNFRRPAYGVTGWPFVLAALLICYFCPYTQVTAAEMPPLYDGINDYAQMFPQASYDDLSERLKRFKTVTGYSVVVLTVRSIADDDLEDFGRKAFANLPFDKKTLARSVLLVIVRDQQWVALQTGAELRSLFPQPQAQEKIYRQVQPYLNGMRSDLGIHAGVHFIFGIIRGEFRVDRATESEQLESFSKRGGGAGAVLAIFLAPFLAFFAGMIWGIYATQFNFQRETRLFMGALLGGGSAKIVATLMSFMGHYSDALWYFIMALSIPLGLFGSLTEYWMSGSDWSGIPRIKEKRRKPEDNMGI